MPVVTNNINRIQIINWKEEPIYMMESICQYLVWTLKYRYFIKWYSNDPMWPRHYGYDGDVWLPNIYGRKKKLSELANATMGQKIE